MSREYIAVPLDVDNPPVLTDDLLYAPNTPTAPNQFWLELPGQYLRISALSLFGNDTLNASGIIYAGYPVNT